MQNLKNKLIVFLKNIVIMRNWQSYYLLDDNYDGSDCQMGAAYYIAKLDKEILKSKKDLLLQVQENDVDWKRPFPANEHLEWI